MLWHCWLRCPNQLPLPEMSYCRAGTFWCFPACRVVACLPAVLLNTPTSAASHPSTPEDPAGAVASLEGPHGKLAASGAESRPRLARDSLFSTAAACAASVPPDDAVKWGLVLLLGVLKVLAPSSPKPAAAALGDDAADKALLGLPLSSTDSCAVWRASCSAAAGSGAWGLRMSWLRPPSWLALCCCAHDRSAAGRV